MNAQITMAPEGQHGLVTVESASLDEARWHRGGADGREAATLRGRPVHMRGIWVSTNSAVSEEDDALLWQLRRAIHIANGAAFAQWIAGLTPEQEEARRERLRQQTRAYAYVNEGGEGYGSPVAREEDNTPYHKGDNTL